jgi:hypothetical protein
MSELDRYREVLGVSADAGPEEIKRAYRELAKKHHPDVSDGPDAAERFVRISEAYEKLLAHAAQGDGEAPSPQEEPAPEATKAPPKAHTEAGTSRTRPRPSGRPPVEFARNDLEWLRERSTGRSAQIRARRRRLWLAGMYVLLLCLPLLVAYCWSGVLTVYEDEGDNFREGQPLKEILITSWLFLQVFLFAIFVVVAKLAELRRQKW